MNSSNGQATLLRVNRAATAAVGPAAPELHHFPAPFTPFIGRDAELGRLMELLADARIRLVTIVGPGGMGKTRLAVQAAQLAAQQRLPFDDGIFFVPLFEISAPHRLAPVLANSLGMTLADQVSPEAQLLGYLQTAQLLLVLDNFEHLQPEASLLAQLLAAGPGVKLLVTSQQPLNLRAEWRLALGGLTYPGQVVAGGAAPPGDTGSAVELFLQVAHQSAPGFTPTAEDEAAIVRICQLVEGMPLALEIAASWVRLVDCQTIARWIEQDPDRLQTTLQDLPARHRSMRAIFNHAWALLSATEQRLLAQVAIFAGSFDLVAAQRITGSGVEDLSVLVDRALLARVERGRLAMHRLIRHYAVQKLGSLPAMAEEDQAEPAADLRAVTQESHARYYLSLLREDAGTGQAPLAPSTQDAIMRDLEEVHQAWDFAVEHLQEPLADKARRLSQFYQLKGLFQEGAARFGYAVATLRSADADAQDAGRREQEICELLLQQGVQLAAMGEHRVAIGRFREAREGWQRLGNPDRESQALAELGIAHWRLEEYEIASGLLAESRDAGLAAGSRHRVAYALHHLANLMTEQGEGVAARPLQEEALAGYQAAGDRWHEAGLLNDLGVNHFYQGEMDEARRMFEASLELHRQLGDLAGSTRPQSNLGYLALLSREYDQARDILQACLVAHEEMGATYGSMLTLHNLGHLAVEQGDLAGAADYYRRSLQLAQAYDAGQERLASLAGLAAVAAGQGRYRHALELLAAVAAAPGAEAVFDMPVEGRIAMHALQASQEALGQQEAAAATARGEALTLAEVVARELEGEPAA